MSEEILHVEDLLRQVSLFQGLDNRQISVLVDRLELVPLDRKEILFSEGDPGESMYIVFRGEVLVTRGAGEGERILANLTAGDTIGEEAMLYGRPRSATISAVEPTVLLRISSTLYAHLLQENPQFGPNLEATAEKSSIGTRSHFPMVGSGGVGTSRGPKAPGYPLDSFVWPFSPADLICPHFFYGLSDRHLHACNYWCDGRCAGFSMGDMESVGLGERLLHSDQSTGDLVGTGYRSL